MFPIGDFDVPSMVNITAVGCEMTMDEPLAVQVRHPRGNVDGQWELYIVVDSVFVILDDIWQSAFRTMIADQESYIVDVGHSVNAEYIGVVDL